MKRWMQLHRWIALIVVTQMLLWLISGLGLSLLDEDLVRANEVRRAAPEQQPLSSWQLASPEPLMLPSLDSLQVTQLLGRPYYLIKSTEPDYPPKLFDAQTLESAQIDETFALALAQQIYAGGAAVHSVRYLSAEQHPVVFAPYDLWQISFNDRWQTDIYVNPVDGRIATVRNQVWWWHELFLTLHFMDFTGSGGFNHAWVIVLAWLSLALSVSGSWLVGKQFVMGQYRRKRLRGRSNTS